ncbi:MAG: hypothetical protein LAT65_08900 [Saccharospirillum sp.]|nr:hypothetical protein [Saccharospirillum sp.]
MRERLGVPAGAVRSVQEALNLDQLKDRDLLLEVPVVDSAIDRANIFNAGFKFTHDGPGVRAPTPPHLHCQLLDLIQLYSAGFTPFSLC